MKVKKLSQNKKKQRNKHYDDKQTYQNNNHMYLFT